MPAKRYTVANRVFSKVAVSSGHVHVVEEGNFWKGDKSWEHRAVCGASISGTPVSLQKVSCPTCRSKIEELRDGD